MTKPDPKIVAQNLVALREHLGLSQREVADALGFSRDRLNKLEHGRANVVTNKLIRPLAHFYGVREEDLTDSVIERPGFNIACVPYLLRYFSPDQINRLIRDIRSAVIQEYGGRAPLLSKSSLPD